MAQNADAHTTTPPSSNAENTSMLHMQLALIRAERDALAERCEFLTRLVDRKLSIRGGLWRAVIDSVPTALAITDSHFRIILCNPMFTSLFGPDESAARGAVFSQFMNDGELFSGQESVGRGTRQTVWSFRREDGSLFLGAVQRTPLYDPDECLIGFLMTVRDLTHQEPAEPEPAPQPGMLPVLHEQSPVLMFAVDASGLITSASDAWLEKLGCKREEVMGQVAANFLTRASRRYLAEALRSRILEAELWKNVETQFVKKTGEVIDVVLCAMKEHDDEAGDERIVFVLQDVTEQKRAEQELMARTLEFETLTDHIPVQIFRLDRQYRYQFVNRAVLEAFATTSETLLGRPIDESGLPGRVIDLWKRQVDAVYASGEALEFELDYATPRGHRFFRSLLVPEKRAGGKIRTIIGIVRDVSEERRASEQLKQSEANLKLAQELASLGSYELDLHDPAGNYMSEEIYRILGLDPETEELTTDRFLKHLVHRADRDRVGQTIRDAMLSESSFELEYRIVRLRGEVRHVQSRGTVIIDGISGSPRLVGTLLDITERVADEVQKRAMQQKLLYQQKHAREIAESELEKVKDELVRKTRLAAVGQVAASIAHELRNPLGAIRNAVYILDRKSTTKGDTYGDYLEIIQRAAATGEQIISDLLNMTRNKPPAKKRLDLCDELAMAFGRFDAHTGIRFVREMAEQPFGIYADSGQLQQVFHNLFTNAIEAMDGAGRIAVHAERREGYDCIVIRDEGPGIPDDMQSLVFEPLFTTKASGTGLGLSICKQIIEQHEGEISVGNNPVRGSRFTIRIPGLQERSATSLTDLVSSHE